jgi:hypothetical protein
MVLEDRINSVLRKLHIHNRGIEREEDRVLIRAEIDPSNELSKQMDRSLLRLGMRKENSSYGRWVYRINNPDRFE